LRQAAHVVGLQVSGIFLGKRGGSTRGIASGSSLGKSSHKDLEQVQDMEGPLFLFTPLRLSPTLLPL
jgi:hypothetical protein